MALRKKQRTATAAPETQNQKIHSLYELLSIIDSKATALLSFNALLLAAISIWLNYVPDNNFLHLSLDIVFLFLLASCILLLPIIFLRWSRPRDITKLEKRRHIRTYFYWAAWSISAIAVLGITGISAIHTIGTGLKTFGRCQSPECQHFFGPKVFGNIDRPSD